MLQLGILGAGSIGCRIAQAVADGTLPFELVAVLEHNDAARARVSSLLPGTNFVADASALVSSADVVVEAAGAAAVAPLVEAARAASKRGGGPGHVVVMSVGGLLDVESSSDGPVIHIPSGAIGGLDAVQALAIAGLDEVTLTTRKPPAGLGMDVTEETLLFEGSARDVIARYPKNVNVAVALSFAGVGPDRTRCRLYADPGVERNTHHVYARGTAGEVEFTSRNVAFPDNPATSYLAALSAIALLLKLASKIQVG